MKDKREIRTLSIPPEVYSKSKVVAAETKRSWSQMVVDLLVKEIKKHKKEK